MKDDEFAIVADYLWKREVDLFTIRVFDALDEHFGNISEKDRDLATVDAFIFVRARLQQDSEGRPYFDKVYNERFAYYIENILPDLIDNGPQIPYIKGGSSNGR